MNVVAAPLAILAELTHRCPLQCFYCSNPLALEHRDDELETDDWLRVLDQAADLGVLQIHFSGGEPLARRDLPALIAHATMRKLYTNIITSGVALTDALLATLIDSGVDHIQLSFQDAQAEMADYIGGYQGAHSRKLAAARRIKNAGLPLTLNFVVHRLNADRVEQMIALAEHLGAGRIEVAHVQYYGWALQNRDALLPTSEQLLESTRIVEAARLRLKGVLTIDYVVPDYYASRPKACMGGWGQRFINITPSGKVLPCHAAETIADMKFANIREHTLRDIWLDSEAFRRYRGTDWMPELCKQCDRREIDWGGCRCQALALLGDASTTDPVCSKSAQHPLMAQTIATSMANQATAELIPRR